MSNVKISNAPPFGLPTGAALTGAEFVPMDQTVTGITTTIKATVSQIVALATGGVSSVVGTANQIAVSTVSGVATISLPQNVIIPTPGSGTAVVVNGATGAYAAQFNSASSAAGNGVQIQQLHNSSTDIALEVAAAVNNYLLVWGDGHIEIGPNVGSGTNGLVIATTGAALFNTPSSGSTVTAGGVGSSSTAAFAAGGSGTGFFSSLVGVVGLCMNSTGADFGNIGNPSAQVWQLGHSATVAGIGSAALTWSAPTGNVQINDGNASMFDAGFRGAPFKSLATGAYTPILSDAGKYLDCVNGTAVTLPTNASVTYPLGTVITLVGDFGAGSATVAAGAGETLFWAGQGALVTGTRTIGIIGVACVLRISTSQWVLSGTGIS